LVGSGPPKLRARPGMSRESWPLSLVVLCYAAGALSGGPVPCCAASAARISSRMVALLVRPRRCASWSRRCASSVTSRVLTIGDVPPRGSRGVCAM